MINLLNEIRICRNKGSTCHETLQFSEAISLIGSTTPFSFNLPCNGFANSTCGAVDQQIAKDMNVDQPLL